MEGCSSGESSRSSVFEEQVSVKSDSSLNASTSSGISDVQVSNVITDQMIAEEIKLEKQAIKEERKLQQKMLMEAEAQKIEEQCYKRLNLLLNRSCIYAQFMADKVKRDNVKEAKKQARNKIATNKRENDSHPCSSRKKVCIEKSVMGSFETEHIRLEGNQEADDHKESKENKINQPRLLTGGTMHPYQLDGFEWLKVLFENGVNGILADEMGLGKTIQCIALIAYLIEMGINGPFFVCGPLSTVENWYAEFKRFTPSIPVFIYHGDKPERELLRNKIKKKIKNRDVNCYPVIITSYQIALIDAKHLKKFHWSLLTIDEAHRIKNFQCKLVTVLKTYHTSNRLLLTGTPLQNDLRELWSLLNFILPEIFDDLKVFESWFDITRLCQEGGITDIIAKEEEKQIVTKIHQILTPFLLRRTKAEVNLKLPQKKEVIVHAHLTDLQRKYYTAALDHRIEEVVRGTVDEKLKKIDLNSCPPKRTVTKKIDLEKYFKEAEENSFEEADNYEMEENFNLANITETSKNVPEVINDAEINITKKNITMMLRKICNHPYLISYPLTNSGDYKVDEELINSSGKLIVLDKLLQRLQKEGHKVVLFTQFVVMIEIIIDFCRLRNYKYNLLHGRVNLKDRSAEIQEFKESPDAFLFLISTRAGGLGINLAEADTVIIYDSDWNPQSDLQAQDRCHRIGQFKPVVVYRLIVPNTIDGYIYQRAYAKRALDKAIIKQGRFCGEDQTDCTIEELRELLNSCDNKILPASEIEKLLDRSDM